jgi:hypothetical protein
LRKREVLTLQRRLRVARVRTPEVVAKLAAEEVEAAGRGTPLHPVRRI